MIHSLTKTVYIILILLGIFFLGRLGLYVTHYDFFSTMESGRVLFSFFHGVRFDIAIGLTFIFPILLLMNLPFKIFTSKFFNWIGGWYIFLVIVAYIHILVGDILYFGYVKRHLADELLLLQGDKTFLLEMVPVYWLETILGFTFILIASLFWQKFNLIETKTNKKPWLTFVLIFLAFFLFIRGSVSNKPISVVNAYVNGDSKEASLTLNGVFTAYHYGRRSKKENFNFYDNETALKNLDLENKEFPLEKNYQGEKSGLNVVVVLMESWTPKYIDSYGANLGVTPNFDRLAGDGVTYTNFYAAGQRSIEGIQAALTGVPPIKGVPSLGFGLEISNITRLGKILENNDYEKMFIQTSNRGSFYVDAIAKSLGFSRYFGKEDMPPILEYPDPKGAKFGWDYEGYMKLFEEIEKTKDKNFFAFLFTGSTHTPYPRLPKHLEKYKHDGEEQSFYNLMNYSDWSIGKFMEKAEKTEWFDNTVFIFTADHVMAHYKEKDGTFLDDFRVPFIIYSPKHFDPSVETKVTSQIQIMPTVIDLLGFSDTFYSFDDSIFKTQKRSALVYAGGIVGAVTEKGFLKHAYSNRLETSLEGEELENEETKMLSTAQITSKLIKENRFAK